MNESTLTLPHDCLKIDCDDERPAPVGSDFESSACFVAGTLVHTQDGSFALQLVASAQHGQVQLLADGNFQYTPDANFFGQDAFTYRYSNGSGLDDGLSEIATVSISVSPVNDAPVASDVAVTTLEDNAATINLVALDAGNTPATLQFVIQNAPQNGTLTANPDGSYSYQPAANFHGADSFTDTACRTESDLRGSYAIHA